MPTGHLDTIRLDVIDKAIQNRALASTITSDYYDKTHITLITFILQSRLADRLVTRLQCYGVH